MSNEPKYLTDTDRIFGRFLSAVAFSALKKAMIKAIRQAYERGYADGAAGREPKP